jgi:hypothetical protein
LAVKRRELWNTKDTINVVIRGATTFMNRVHTRRKC